MSFSTRLCTPARCVWAPARVGQVHFAALDPTWLGIERLPGLNDEVRRRWPAIVGPLDGPLGEWAAILPCLNTSGSLIRAMETVAPRRVERARAVMRRLGSEASLRQTASHALEYVWDLLADQLDDLDRALQVRSAAA